MAEASAMGPASASKAMQEPLRVLVARCGTQILISACDYEHASSRRWSINEPKPGLKYARCSIDGRSVWLHRWLMRDALSEGSTVDHRDGDGLNNQRSNLRLCTQGQNNYNRGPMGGRRYKGVSRYGGVRGWIARVAKDGRDYYLGVFTTPRKAAAAYNRAARRLFGEFAWLNDLTRR
jgi:hypothetical protein